VFVHERLLVYFNAFWFQILFLCSFLCAKAHAKYNFELYLPNIINFKFHNRISTFAMTYNVLNVVTFCVFCCTVWNALFEGYRMILMSQLPCKNRVKELH